MNAFEPLLWMGCVWCVVRMINLSEPRYWFWFGVLTGVGLETKYSIVFLVFGVLAGALVGPQRRFLKSRWLRSGMLVAAILALPNFLWQLGHDFPFLQLIHNIRMGNRDIVRGPVSFLVDQAAIMNPILFPLWAGGLLWLFFGHEGRRYRLLAEAQIPALKEQRAAPPRLHLDIACEQRRHSAMSTTLSQRRVAMALGARRQARSFAPLRVLLYRLSLGFCLSGGLSCGGAFLCPRSERYISKPRTSAAVPLVKHGFGQTTST